MTVDVDTSTQPDSFVGDFNEFTAIAERAAEFWTAGLTAVGPTSALFDFNVRVEFDDLQARFGVSTSTLGVSVNDGTREADLFSDPDSTIVLSSRFFTWYFDSNLPAPGSGQKGSTEFDAETESRRTLTTNFGPIDINDGRSFNTLSNATLQGTSDVLTVLIHEMGHSIGARELPTEDFDAEDPLALTRVGPFNGGTLPIQSRGGGHLSLVTAVMDDVLFQGQRRLPSGADYLFAAETTGYRVDPFIVANTSQVVPLPPALAMAGGAMALLYAIGRQRRGMPSPTAGDQAHSG
ncbi:MAG: hypothetical protein AAF677_16235 [Pseudomonadota bacterium]